MLVELNRTPVRTLFSPDSRRKLDLFIKSTAAPRFGGNWSAAFLRRALSPPAKQCREFPAVSVRRI